MKAFFTTIFVLFALIKTYSQDISGDWTGELNFAGNTLDLNFLIYKQGAEYYSTLSVPAQSLYDFKSTSTSLVDSLLTIDLKPLGIKYQGEWSTKDTIAGNFTQNGMSLKLNLIRGNTKLNRPQEPKPPYDYHVEDVEFRNEKDSINLAGTLTLPKKEGKFPIVILISGSGPQDRNSFILGHKPFLLLAHELTQSGVGVFRYDERGVGESEGEFLEATLDDFMADVKSAYVFLKTRDEVDKEKIGLLGHSLGGVIAPRLAVKEDISFLILLAAPGIDGDEMMLKQRADFLKLRGLNDKQVEQSNEVFKNAYRFIRTNNASGEEFKVELTQFMKDNYADAMMEKELMTIVEQLSSNEFLGLLRNRPSQYLGLVNCPVLALGGSKDFQVASKENLAAIETELNKAGNPDVEIKEFEGLNHLFQECETGDVSEYGVIEQTMSPEVIEYIIDWLGNRL